MNSITYGSVLTTEEYCELRTSAGWKIPSSRQIEISRSNNVFAVAARCGGKYIGMTRLVSDGAYFYLLVDVIVHPEYQGKGIGKTMVSMALDYIRSNLREGEIANVNMMAAKRKEPFYRKLGFIERPNEEFGAGMMMYLSV
jgi:GNAT superfamily N-acetyltransferase